MLKKYVDKFKDHNPCLNDLSENPLEDLDISMEEVQHEGTHGKPHTDVDSQELHSDKVDRDCATYARPPC